MFKKKVDEAAYVGNIGAMEMFRFHQKASKEQKEKLKRMVKNKDAKGAWKHVQDVTGTKLHKSVYEERTSPHPDVLGPKGAGNDGSPEALNSYLKDTPGHEHLVGKKPQTFKGFLNKRHK